MKSIFSRILKDGTVYSLQPMIEKLVGFILIPVYTAYLNPSEFGNLQYVLTFGVFFNTIIGMGLSSSFWKFRVSNKEFNKNDVTINLLFGITFIGISLFLISCFLKIFLYSDSLLATFVLVYFFTQLIAVIYRMTLLVMRANFNARKYVVASLTNSLLFMILNIVFIVYFHMSYEGIIYSSLVGFILSGILFAHVLKQEFSGKLNFSLIGEMIKYGFPLMLGNLAAIVISMSDRFFLKELSNDTQLGLYSFGYKMGELINVVLINSFFLAWNPIRWQVYGMKNGKEIFSKVNRLLLVFLPIIGLFILAFIIILGSFLTVDKSYLDGFQIISMVAFSNIFYGYYYFNSMGMLFENKTNLIMNLIIGAGLLNIVLNYLLIPKYEMLGASVATIISYFFMYTTSLFFCQKYYPIERQWSNEVVQTILIFLTTVFLTQAYHFITNIYWYASTAMVLSGLFFITSLSFKFIRFNELRSLKTMFKIKRKQPSKI